MDQWKSRQKGSENRSTNSSERSGRDRVLPRCRMWRSNGSPRVAENPGSTSGTDLLLLHREPVLGQRENR
jgi:hypothetical protein